MKEKIVIFFKSSEHQAFWIKYVLMLVMWEVLFFEQVYQLDWKDVFLKYNKD
jgi:hypothetical protein